MKRKNSLLILSCFIFISFSLQAQTGGPDAFGYTWRQYRAADGAKWIDISSRQGTFNLADNAKINSLVGPINFSFDFPYYWYHHNSFYVSRSGYIAFQPITLGAPYDALPMDGGQGNDYIAPLLTIHTSAHDNGKIYFWTDFKDSVIVSYVDLAYRLPDGSTSGTNTFQVILCKNDSSITFQYIDHVGSYNNTSCPTLTPGSIPNCQIIGIENIIGQGLVHSINNETVLLGISEADPLAIRYTPSKVAQQGYSLKNLAVSWNNNPQNGGQFISQNGPQPTLKSSIKNFGTVASPAAQAKGTIYRGGTSLSSTSTAVPALQKEESAVLKFTNKLPTSVAGFHSLETEVVYSEDQYPGNNKLKQLLIVVDTTNAETELDYSGGTSSGSIAWAGTKRFQAGNGVYIEPPFYPVKIKAITFGTSPFGANPAPADSLRFRIYDNNGANVFGVKDGSRGDLLFQQDIGPLDYAHGDGNILEVPGDIQINSGGVYICVLQGLQNTIRLNYRVADPVSYRTYEVNGLGGFNVYRDRKTQDFVLGINVAKGDVTQVFDLSLNNVIQPQQTDVITDSIEVKIEIKNTGPQKVVGPFDVAYQADTRPEVMETIPASVEIDLGQTYVYTFKQKSARPPAPRTQYNNFCTRVAHPNDFVLTNDTSCYFATVGINSQLPGVDGLLLFPNPSRGTVQIGYGLSAATHTAFELLDVSGRLIQRNELGFQAEGVYSHTIQLNALPGVYIYRLITDRGVYTDRLVLLQ